MTQHSPRPTPHRRRKEARPQELTAAALALFVEKGFAATRLDEIAARAGVSKGTLYLYFDSKEALFKAVIQEGIVPAIAEGEAMLDTQADPRELLRAILLGWWERIGSTELGGIPKLMLSEARNFPEVAVYYQQAVIERGIGLLRTALQRGVAQGVFRPLELESACNVLIAPLIFRALWRHSFGPCCGNSTDTEQYLRTYLDITLNGLLARPGRGECA